MNLEPSLSILYTLRGNDAIVSESSLIADHTAVKAIEVFSLTPTPLVLPNKLAFAKKFELLLENLKKSNKPIVYN